MADWGSIGTKGNLVKSNYGITVPQYFRRIMIGFDSFSRGGKNTSEGDPSQPSLELIANGVWRFRWVVQSGTRGVSVNVKQSVNYSPRPSIIVKANPDIGVNADVTATAGSGTGWVTIGPANITPSSAGAVWVELHANYDGPTSSFWDNVQVT